MRFVVAVCAGLALLAACGGSQTSTETTTSPTPTGELPSTTSTLPPSTTAETITAPLPGPEPPPSTPTPTPLAPVTTGENIPEALSRDLIPWAEVGPGWYLVAYFPWLEQPADTPREGPRPSPQTIVYLVDGRDAGGLYELAALDGWASIADWRRDGSAALIWMETPIPLSAPEITLLLVDTATGDQQVLAGEHLTGEFGSPNRALGFTTPSGIHLVSRTDDGIAETLASYDFAGNVLHELYSQPIPDHFPGRLSWLYGIEGLDVVVGHSKGMSLIDNRGGPIRELWVPGDDYCQPVRWWSEDEFLARCTSSTSRLGNRPDFPLDTYYEPWLIRTDGNPAWSAPVRVTKAE